MQREALVGLLYTSTYSSSHAPLPVTTVLWVSTHCSTRQPMFLSRPLSRVAKQTLTSTPLPIATWALHSARQFGSSSVTSAGRTPSSSSQYLARASLTKSPLYDTQTRMVCYCSRYVETSSCGRGHGLEHVPRAPHSVPAHPPSPFPLSLSLEAAPPPAQRRDPVLKIFSLPKQASSGKVTDWVKPNDKSGEFKRQTSSFRDWISADPGAQFPVEKGRYHLYISYACPWATRAIVARKLKGLEEFVSVSSVHVGFLAKFSKATLGGDPPRRGTPSAYLGEEGNPWVYYSRILKTTSSPLKSLEDSFPD